MPQSLVFTFIGPDKPGLVQKISRAVTDCGGNWLESRMAQLSGQFAGIARIGIDAARADELRRCLEQLSGGELTVVVQPSADDVAPAKCRVLKLSIVGNDRPGIVREVAGALADRSINVREMSTNITSAPMTAESLFEAYASIEVPLALDLGELQQRLDAIAGELTVDISLED